MSLFQRFHVGENAAAHLWHGLAFKTKRLLALDAIRHRIQARADVFDQCVVAKITRRRHDHAARAIAQLEEFEEIFPLETRDGFFPAANRPGDWVSFEK